MKTAGRYTPDELATALEEAMRKAVVQVRYEARTSLNFTELEDAKCLAQALEVYLADHKKRLFELFARNSRDNPGPSDAEMIRRAEADAAEKGDDIDDIRPGDRFLGWSWPTSGSFD